LRPASSDGLPLLGPTSLDGYFTALGHFRNGILLAPITAEILSGWLLRGKSPVPADAFLPARLTQ
jgi:glycine oxidase